MEISIVSVFGCKHGVQYENFEFLLPLFLLRISYYILSGKEEF